MTKKKVFFAMCLAVFLAPNVQAARTSEEWRARNDISTESLRAIERANDAMDYADNRIAYFYELNPDKYAVGIENVDIEIATLLDFIAVLRDANDWNAINNVRRQTQILLNAIAQIEAS